MPLHDNNKYNGEHNHGYEQCETQDDLIAAAAVSLGGGGRRRYAYDQAAGGPIGDGDSCGAVIDESVTEIITDGDATAVVSGGEVGAIASTECD